jgi:exodeoxyribonuclease VII small subunit
LQKINFEKSLARLEEITQKLESGELSLDESLKLFEEGISLSRFCQKKLTETEQKIEVLKSSDMDDFSEEELKDDSSHEEDDEESVDETRNDAKKKKKKTTNLNPNAGGKENFLF